MFNVETHPVNNVNVFDKESFLNNIVVDQQVPRTLIQFLDLGVVPDGKQVNGCMECRHNGSVLYLSEISMNQYIVRRVVPVVKDVREDYSIN